MGKCLHWTVVGLADAIALSLAVLVIVRSEDEIERVNHNPADAAAKHDDVLLPEPFEMHWVEPIDEDPQGEEDENVDDGWVHNQRNELSRRVNLHVFVTGAGNQDDNGGPDGQPHQVIVDPQSLHKLQWIEREYTNIGLPNQIPAAA